MHNMHLLSFDHEPSTKRGGQELALFEVLTHLSQLGYSITLGYEIEGNLVQEYKKHGIKTIQIPRLNIEKTYSFIQWFELIKSALLLRSKKNGIIYINQIFDTPLASIIKLMSRKKLICHLRLPPMGNSLLIKMTSKFVDGFIVANRKMFDLHHKKTGIPIEKLTIIPDGIALSEIKKRGKKTSSFQIAYVGRISEHKGLLVLIEAIKRLTQLTTTKFHLDIAGSPTKASEYAFLEKLHTRITKLKINNYISFVGYIEDVANHLSKYDLCIFPSTIEESFGRVLVESINAFTPVISNDIGSVSEITDDKTKEWIYTNETEMLKIILKIMNNPETYPIVEKRNHIYKNYEINIIIKRINAYLIKFYK